MSSSLGLAVWGDGVAEVPEGAAGAGPSRDTSSKVLRANSILFPNRPPRLTVRPLRYPSRLLGASFAWESSAAVWPGAAGRAPIKCRA